MGSRSGRCGARGRRSRRRGTRAGSRGRARACGGARRPRPRPDGLDDREVVGGQRRDALDARQRVVPEPHHVDVQPVEGALQLRVVRRRPQRAVGFAVERDQAVRAARARRARRGCAPSASRGPPARRRGAAGGQLGRERLQIEPHLEDVLDVGGMEVGDDRAAPRAGSRPGSPTRGGGAPGAPASGRRRSRRPAPARRAARRARAPARRCARARSGRPPRAWSRDRWRRWPRAWR